MKVNHEFSPALQTLQDVSETLSAEELIAFADQAERTTNLQVDTLRTLSNTALAQYEAATNLQDNDPDEVKRYQDAHTYIQNLFREEVHKIFFTP